MTGAWPLLGAALVPLVALFAGIALGRRLGKGERDVLGYRLAEALADVEQAAEFAQSGQPDRVLGVLNRARTTGGWRGLLSDLDDGEADAAGGEAEVSPSGGPRGLAS